MVNGRENFCIQARMGIIITQERSLKMRPNMWKMCFWRSKRIWGVLVCLWYFGKCMWFWESIFSTLIHLSKHLQGQLGSYVDSIAASLFVLNWLSWRIVSDDKIQITILILRRGTLSSIVCLNHIPFTMTKSLKKFCRTSCWNVPGHVVRTSSGPPLGMSWE